MYRGIVQNFPKIFFEMRIHCEVVTVTRGIGKINGSVCQVWQNASGEWLLMVLICLYISIKPDGTSS